MITASKFYSSRSQPKILYKTLSEALDQATSHRSRIYYLKHL